MPFTLNFQTKSDGGRDLDQIQKILAEVQKRTNASSGELKILESVLKSDAQAGRSLSDSLKEITRSTESFGSGTRKAIGDVIAMQGEIQKLGRIQDQEGEKARRRAQQDLRQNIGLARGAGAVSGLAGVQIPGLSQGATAISGLASAGLESTAIAAGAALGAITALSVGTVKLANDLGDYARTQQNIASVTGLTTTGTQLLSRTAEVLGVNVSSLTATMRTLSKGLSDNSEEGRKAKQGLAELGITGAAAFEPMDKLLPNILTKLGAVNSTVERDRLAVEILGRSGLELSKLSEQFGSVSEAVKATGVIIDEEGIKKAAEYRKEAALLGLEWDNVVNKFKQKAVGVVSYVIEPFVPQIPRAPGVTTVARSPKDIEAERAGFTEADLARIRKRDGVAPGDPGYRADGSSDGDIRSQLAAVTAKTARDNAATLAAISKNERTKQIANFDQRSETPKERLQAKIKTEESALPGLRDKAVEAPQGSRDDTAYQSAKTALEADKARLASLSEIKKANEDIIRLQEKITSDSTKELFGRERINAEFQAEIAHLTNKKELTGKTLEIAKQLAEQDRVVKTRRFEQSEAIGQARDDRDIARVASTGKRQLQRADLEGQARVELSAGKNTGEDAEGISKAYESRKKLAQLDYEAAGESIKAIREESAIREGIAHNETALRAEKKAIIEAENARAIKFAIESGNAERSQIIETNALKQKDRKEAEQALTAEIANRRAVADITFNADRARGELEGKLRVAQAPHGLELPTELQNDRERQARDAEQSRRNSQRIAEDIAQQQAARENPGADKAAIAIKIGQLEVEYKREAAKIEEDSTKARIEGEIRIAEKRKADREAFASSVQSSFTALISGGQKALTSAIKSQGIGLLGQVAGNAARIEFDTFTKGGKSLSLPGTGTTEKPTGLGRLLEGTLFGPKLSQSDILQKPADKLDRAGDKLIEFADGKKESKPGIPGYDPSTATVRGSDGAAAQPFTALALSTDKNSLAVSDNSTALRDLLRQLAECGCEKSGTQKPLASVTPVPLTSVANLIPELLSGAGKSSPVESVTSSISFDGEDSRKIPAPVNESSNNSTQGILKGILAGVTTGAAATKLVHGTIAAIATGTPLPGGGTPIVGLPSFLGGVGQNPFIFSNHPGKSSLPALSGYDPATGDIGGSTSRADRVNPFARQNSAVPSTTGVGGFTAGLAHTGDVQGIFTGTSSGPNGAETLSTSERVGAAAGTAAAAYGAERAIAAGIRQGGAKGTTQAISAGAGFAATVDPEPISKAVLETVAVVSGLVSSILPSKVDQQKKVIERELATTYQAPQAQNRTQDTSGDYTDYNKFGQTRTSPFSAVQTTVDPSRYRVHGLDGQPGYYVDTPGQVKSEFTPAPTPQAPVAPNQITIQVTNNVQTFDGPSLQGFLVANPNAMNAGIHAAITQANGPAQGSIKNIAAGT